MRTLLYVILLLVATGCGLSSRHPKVLTEAQQLMLSDPSAALSKLNGVDVSEFEDSATMAKWALLYSEAMVANHLSAPTDTIVNIAIDYYGRHDQTDEFHKASHLKALLKSYESKDELATAIYLQKEKEFYLFKERAKREQYILFGIICLLFAMGVIMWMRQRMRTQTILNDTLMAEASCLKLQLASHRGDMDRLESKLRGMLEDRFALIDSLCQTYYESQGTKAERKAIIDKVKSEIESVGTDSFIKMEQAVNDCLDNMAEKIKENCPGIKPDDYRLLIYLASGLSSRTISLLLGESVEVIYKRKSRLKARLKESAASFSTDIISIF